MIAGMSSAARSVSMMTGRSALPVIGEGPPASGAADAGTVGVAGGTPAPQADRTTTEAMRAAIERFTTAACRTVATAPLRGEGSAG
jgi:hypothetical protein